MPTSYTNHYLHIDLTTGQHSTFALPEAVLDGYVGGKGVGAYLLAQYQEPKAAPYEPANPLIFAVGPLTGTQAPSMRSVVVFQSPVTHLFTDSYFGGFFGQELKAAGYDGMVITGAAAEPVYLEINNKQMAIKPAGHLWGLDTFDTYERLRPDYPDKEWRIACIGPAGEHRVAFAAIDCDWHRQAGRGGGGAVMGAKNLKAIVVRGTGRVQIADPEVFKETVKATLGTMKDNSYIQGFRSGGTAASIPWADVEGLLPTRNFQRGSFAGAAALGDEAQRTKYWGRNLACAACPVACSKEITIPEGAHEGQKADTLEYESAGMLGANLEIGDTTEAVCLGLTCDILGLDTISAGAVLSFACEAADRGLLKLETTWGDGAGLSALLDDIAHRRGVGDLLADGVPRGGATPGCGYLQVRYPRQGTGAAGLGPARCAGDGAGLHDGRSRRLPPAGIPDPVRGRRGDVARAELRAPGVGRQGPTPG